MLIEPPAPAALSLPGLLDDALGVLVALLEPELGAGPACAPPDGPGLPAVLPAVLLLLGLAPMVEELAPEDEVSEELGVELGAGLEPELGVELGLELVPGLLEVLGVWAAPPDVLDPLLEVCAIATPPMTRAAAVARVVRVFLLMSCSFSEVPPRGVG
ncbi:hypothetical protein GCM10027034_23090 [Ramlibacter solisilvae]|uniref:hypothetical protein n=1 Tax=Ramlibacter tataouinensis TaxID=94132 RepID=UPI000777E77C|nr:hypothetical protein [Ramlibacter tataouinensis]